MEVLSATDAQSWAYSHFVNTERLRRARTNFVQELRDTADRVEKNSTMFELRAAFRALDRLKVKVEAAYIDANGTREPRGRGDRENGL